MTTVAPWPVVALGDVAETSLGKMLDAGRPKGAVETPYLRNVNVQWGRIDTADVATVPLSDAERCRFSLLPGDLLVCEGGAIGRAAIWHGPEIAYQKALHRVRSRGDLDLRWLRYLLEHYDGIGVLAARATGSTIKHLPQAQLRQLPVPLPSPAEQCRIVDVLDDHLSRLDVGRDDLRAARKRLLSYARSVRHQLTTAGASSLVPLQSLVGSVEAGRSFGNSARPAARDEWGIVKVSAMTWGAFDENQNKAVLEESRVERRFEIQPGDLLVSRANTTAYVGASVVVPACRRKLLLSDKSLRLVPRADVDPRYIHALLQAPEARDQISRLATGTKDSMRNISQSALLSITVPSHAAADQAILVNQVDELQRQMGRLGAQFDRSALRESQLRRSLLGAAFSGRL